MTEPKLMFPSPFRQAVKAQTGQNVIICPHCGEAGPTTDRPASNLELEQSGRWFCSVCSTVFTPMRMERE